MRDEEVAEVDGEGQQSGQQQQDAERDEVRGLPCRDGIPHVRLDDHHQQQQRNCGDGRHVPKQVEAAELVRTILQQLALQVPGQCVSSQLVVPSAMRSPQLRTRLCLLHNKGNAMSGGYAWRHCTGNNGHAAIAGCNAESNF